MSLLELVLDVAGTDLHTIRTTRVIPADLNAFLYQVSKGRQIGGQE